MLYDLNKRFDNFSVYQKTVEDNFSELHILKHKFKLMSQKKNERRKHAKSIIEKQEKDENSQNEDNRNYPLIKLLKSFWQKLKNQDWLEIIDAHLSNNVSNSTLVRLRSF